MHPKDADRMADSVDPDQTAPRHSDLGLYCLPRPAYPKTEDQYGSKYRYYTIYRNDPKFSDRYAWANSADPD